jgi:hypothetical protein
MARTRAKTKTQTGGCLCGAVRYRIDGKPKHVGNCHCTMCQKTTGSLYGSFAGFDADHVRFTKGRPKDYRSSKWAARGFCPKCGSSLTYRLVADATQIWLSLGTMDNTGAYTPDQHIFTTTMVPSLRRVKDGLPRHRAFPG